MSLNDIIIKIILTRKWFLLRKTSDPDGDYNKNNHNKKKVFAKKN